MTPARWLVALLSVAALVAVAVLRREPVPTAELPFREDDDGIQPPDPGLFWREARPASPDDVWAALGASAPFREGMARVKAQHEAGEFEPFEHRVPRP